MDMINQRVKMLREEMGKHHIDAYIIPSTDPHCGEYVPERWESRKWISGFTGSAGTAVVTLNDAALWTDSRYFIQATEQLDGTPFKLMKQGLPDTPSINEWLMTVLPKGSTVGVDGLVTTVDSEQHMRHELMPNHDITINRQHDLIDAIWSNRPPVPSSKAEILPLAFAGESASSKIARIRCELRKNGATHIVITTLDDIAWTLNLRGNDIHCTPVLAAYLIVGVDSATVYINSAKLTNEVRDYLNAEGVELKEYNEIFSDLSQMKDNIIQLERSTVNLAIVDAISHNSCDIIFKDGPTKHMKAIKNQVEQAAFREAMIADGVAMTRFLMWLRPAVEAGNETELSIERKLYACRAEQPGFRVISFDTIDGYKSHGAIVHYEVTKETDCPVLPEGLILIDSGAHYGGGTTDITRTIALGPVSEEEKRDYTLVLKGHIQLAQAVFPEGTTGTQLDVLARSFMWTEKKNYLHGTGHGVGACLSVHEGPHQIRMNHMPAPLLPGMTVTNEPGLYIEGSYGIRTENMMLVQSIGEGMFGNYCHFEILTLCPIDTTPIDWSIMTKNEVKWLNGYHNIVYSRLSPHLNDTERAWLKEATKEINL